jgi:hypothetical protein
VSNVQALVVEKEMQYRANSVRNKHPVSNVHALVLEKINAVSRNAAKDENRKIGMRMRSKPKS